MTLEQLVAEVSVVDDQILEATRSQNGKRLCPAIIQTTRPPGVSHLGSTGEFLATKEAADQAAARRRSNDVSKAKANQQEVFLPKEQATKSASLGPAKSGYGQVNASGKDFPCTPDGKVPLGFRRQA